MMDGRWPAEKGRSLRIHHLALRTRDVARLESFYVRVCDFKIRQRDAARGSVWLDLRSAVLMIEPAEPGEPPIPAGTKELTAFAVDDVEIWRKRLAALGIDIEAETQHTLYFRDPDGRRIAVSNYGS
jgi:catechol 2,3-dioxygenase-like lactoylglutathione lyase family enzyme